MFSPRSVGIMYSCVATVVTAVYPAVSFYCSSCYKINLVIYYFVVVTANVGTCSKKATTSWVSVSGGWPGFKRQRCKDLEIVGVALLCSICRTNCRFAFYSRSRTMVTVSECCDRDDCGMSSCFFSMLLMFQKRILLCIIRLMARDAVQSLLATVESSECCFFHIQLFTILRQVIITIDIF